MKKYTILLFVFSLIISNQTFAKNDTEDICRILRHDNQRNILINRDITRDDLNDNDKKTLDTVITKFSSIYGLTGNTINDKPKILTIVNKIKNLLKIKFIDKGRDFYSLSDPSERLIVILNVYIQGLEKTIGINNLLTVDASDPNGPTINKDIVALVPKLSFNNYSNKDSINSYGVHNICLNFTDQGGITCFKTELERKEGINEYKERRIADRNNLIKMLSETNAKDFYKERPYHSLDGTREYFGIDPSGNYINYQGILYNKEGTIEFSKDLLVKSPYTDPGYNILTPEEKIRQQNSFSKLNSQAQNFFNTLKLGGSITYDQNLGKQSAGIKTDNVAYHRFYASEGGKAQIIEIDYGFNGNGDVSSYREKYSNGNYLELTTNPKTADTPYGVSEGEIGGGNFGWDTMMVSQESSMSGLSTEYDSRGYYMYVPWAYTNLDSGVKTFILNNDI